MKIIRSIEQGADTQHIDYAAICRDLEKQGFHVDNVAYGDGHGIIQLNEKMAGKTEITFLVVAKDFPDPGADVPGTISKHVDSIVNSCSIKSQDAIIVFFSPWDKDASGQNIAGTAYVGIRYIGEQGQFETVNNPTRELKLIPRIIEALKDPAEPYLEDIVGTAGDLVYEIEAYGNQEPVIMRTPEHKTEVFTVPTPPYADNRNSYVENFPWTEGSIVVSIIVSIGAKIFDRSNLNKYQKSIEQKRDSLTISRNLCAKFNDLVQGNAADDMIEEKALFGKLSEIVREGFETAEQAIGFCTLQRKILSIPALGKRRDYMSKLDAQYEAAYKLYRRADEIFNELTNDLNNFPTKLDNSKSQATEIENLFTDKGSAINKYDYPQVKAQFDQAIKGLQEAETHWNSKPQAITKARTAYKVAAKNLEVVENIVVNIEKIHTEAVIYVSGVIESYAKIGETVKGTSGRLTAIITNFHDSCYGNTQTHIKSLEGLVSTIERFIKDYGGIKEMMKVEVILACTTTNMPENVRKLDAHMVTANAECETIEGYKVRNDKYFTAIQSSYNQAQQYFEQHRSDIETGSVSDLSDPKADLKKLSDQNNQAKAQYLVIHKSAETLASGINSVERKMKSDVQEMIDLREEVDTSYTQARNAYQTLTSYISSNGNVEYSTKSQANGLSVNQFGDSKTRQNMRDYVQQMKQRSDDIAEILRKAKKDVSDAEEEERKRKQALAATTAAVAVSRTSQSNTNNNTSSRGNSGTKF